jgi:hypothetical protein
VRQHKAEVTARAVQRLTDLYGSAVNYQLAEVHAQMGQVDQAFAVLNRAWQYKDPGLVYVRADAWMEPIRGDPRFTALLNKIGFPAL